MPPVISIVGIANSGKTTFLEGLIGELKARGYRVATVKHTPEGMSFDKPDKDSWRHLQAGSEATAISSSNSVVLITPVTQDPPVDEIVGFFGEEHDIILAEGFKQDKTPKIEIHRKEVGPPLESVKKLIAIVTDEPLETRIRQFALEDIKGVADFVENGFIKPQQERLSLYVNGAPVSLSTFPKGVTASVLVALVRNLKGIEEDIRNIKVFLKRGTKHR